MNGGTIAGATSPTLTFTPALLGDTGSYDVVVTSPASCGGGTQVTTSNAVIFTVTDPCANNPRIMQAPAPASTCPSGAASFTVTATGTGPITYRWQRETTPGTFINLSNGRTTWDGCGGSGLIFGSTTRSLIIAADTAGGLALCSAHAVRYRCMVTSTCGSIASDPATLTIGQPADIAYDDGTPLPPLGALTGVNNGVTEADYNVFFANFFDSLPICDIANDDGTPLPPFGPLTTNNGVTEGDYNLFFSTFFEGCAL